MFPHWMKISKSLQFMNRNNANTSQTCLCKVTRTSKLTKFSLICNEIDGKIISETFTKTTFHYLWKLNLKFQTLIFTESSIQLWNSSQHTLRNSNYKSPKAQVKCLWLEIVKSLSIHKLNLAVEASTVDLSITKLHPTFKSVLTNQFIRTNFFETSISVQNSHILN